MHRRQAVEIIPPEWAGFRVPAVCLCQVHVITTQQRIARDNVVLPIMGVACKAGCGVEHRVDKDKLGRIPLCFSLEPQRGDQRQMAACTVTTKRDAVFIHADFFCMLPDKLRRSLCIIMRSGEGMLRCQPVLNRNHPTLTVKRQLAELIVMGCKPTADKTTAMVVECTR